MEASIDNGILTLTTAQGSRVMLMDDGHTDIGEAIAVTPKAVHLKRLWDENGERVVIEFDDSVSLTVTGDALRLALSDERLCQPGPPYPPTPVCVLPAS